MRTLTKEERAAIRCLQRLAKRWPPSLSLLGDGKLNVMDRIVSAQYNEFSKRGELGEWKKRAQIARINLNCDAGDPW